MAIDTVSILDGNTFVVSDRRGDLEGTPIDNHGLFLNDTRFLSRWSLTIDGRRPALLSVDEQAYARVQFFLALATGTVNVDSPLSVVRRRTTTAAVGFSEEIEIVNHDSRPIDLQVKLEVAADFADLFEVKDGPGEVDKAHKKGQLTCSADAGSLRLGYTRGSYHRETLISSTEPARIGEQGMSFSVHVEPQARWATRLDVTALVDQPARGPKPGGHAAAPEELSVDKWVAAAPRLLGSWEPLGEIYQRSLIDLGALRFTTHVTPGALPAAGLPWLMAIFGRDTLLTSFQALPFVPELAATALRVLPLLQGQKLDPFRDEEPGKILHELRFGELSAFEERPHSPYFGSADATMLFLILLEEYDRWTGDRSVARELEAEARAALAWIDNHGDRDGDGYVEYERRNREAGLDNQCWKDSWNSIVFADGTLAPTPRATCELQGYAYDAKHRCARLARDVWNDVALAERLDREAEQLKRRFNEDFWIERRGFFALALDGNKRQVDSLTSNIGHLLWSGIADDDKAALCVRHLMSEDLYSGWGVRTMAATEGAYNPIGYHLGTVWPHDNSIIAWGLRRYGYRAEAARICRAMLEAADLFRGRLPEAFGGYAREDTHAPVEYPTACSPRAWASGAPLLFIRTLLGLDSDGRHLIIDPALVDPFGQLELLDIPGAWGHMDVFGRARRGRAPAIAAAGEPART
jgi:glycogen debranching enzyme